MTKKNQQAWAVDIHSFPKDATGEEKIQWILRWAILAPSTHNSQPWRFRVGNDFCKIYYNPALRLPVGDSTGRDLYISFGCLIENLVTAAEYVGFFDRVEYASNFDSEYVATIFFKESASLEDRKYSLESMKKRMNARGIFDQKEIPAEAKEGLKHISTPEGITPNFIFDKEKIKTIAGLTAEGLQIAYRRKSFREEVSRWMTSSISNRFDGMPGYALRMPFLMSFLLPKIVRYFDIGKRLGWLNSVSISSTPGVCVITSANDNASSWIKVGRLAQRYFLYLYSQGLKTSVFVASVEMGDLYKKVQKIVETTQRPQFLFCFGYLDLPERHTPRHPVTAKMKLNDRGFID